MYSVHSSYCVYIYSSCKWHFVMGSRCVEVRDIHTSLFYVQLLVDLKLLDDLTSKECHGL